MKRDDLCFDYVYIDGRSEYSILKHEDCNRILPFCVAVSVIEGEYFVDFADTNTVCIKAGETIFIQSFVKHTVRMTRKGKLTHAHFLCRYLMIDIFALATLDYLIVSSNEIFNLLNRLNAQAYENGIAQRLYTDKQICELVLTLVNMNCIDPQKFIIESWLHTSLKYIQAHLRSGVTVDEVILVSGCSKTTFYQMFKSRIGMSPREYIEAERFRHVCMLLLQGRKVEEIACDVGFNDVSYFNKVFKRRYGMSPIEYKQMMKYGKGV